MTRQRNGTALRQFFNTLDLNGIAVRQHQDPFLAHVDCERRADLLGKKLLFDQGDREVSIITKQMLENVLSRAPDNRTTFVLGHSRPDADAIVSSVFEAVRWSRVYSGSCAVWVECIPREVQHILGDDISKLLRQMPKPG